MAAQNQVAWLEGPGKPLRVDKADVPVPGPHDIVVRNRYVAVNPIDTTQARIGLYLKRFPAVLGHDIAGEVYAVGSEVKTFNTGDRVIAQAWQMKTQQSQDSAFALFTKVPASSAAKLPQKISFKDACVLPVALSTAICGLYKILNLPFPSIDPKPTSGVLLVYGGSSSIGLQATQFGVASGVRVVSIASSRNHSLCRKAGASATVDYRDPDLVEQVVAAVGSDGLAGVFDAVADDNTFGHVLKILEKLGGGRVAASHPYPEKVPTNVDTKFIFALDEFTFQVWENFVGKALETGQLQCLPKPMVVGQGLESVQKGIDTLAAGVSAQKVVVEL